jgi:hypothetical protein
MPTTSRSAPLFHPTVPQPHVQVTDFCGRAAHGSWPVCDPSVPAAQRAADIIGRMSLPDKIAALGTDSPALPSVGLRPCATPKTEQVLRVK